MKRNRSTLLGVSLTALAMMIIAVGCSSSNPVAPQTSGIQYENPQYSNGLPWGDTGQPPTNNGQREDVKIELSKLTPPVIRYVEGQPNTPDAVRFDDLRIE